MTSIKTIHLYIGEPRAQCGVRLTETVLTVSPRRAQHVTCRRCIQSLQKLGR